MDFDVVGKQTRATHSIIAKKGHRKAQLRQVNQLSRVGKSSCTINSNSTYPIFPPFPLTAIDSHDPNSRRDFHSKKNRGRAAYL